MYALANDQEAAPPETIDPLHDNDPSYLACHQILAAALQGQYTDGSSFPDGASFSLLAAESQLVLSYLHAHGFASPDVSTRHGSVSFLAESADGTDLSIFLSDPGRGIISRQLDIVPHRSRDLLNVLSYFSA